MGKLTRKNPYKAMPDISAAWRFEEIYLHKAARAELQFHDLDMGLIVKWVVSIDGPKKARWKDYDRSPVSWMLIPPGLNKQTTVIFALDREATLNEYVTDLKGKRRFSSLAKSQQSDFTNFAVFKKRKRLTDLYPNYQPQDGLSDIYTQEEFDYEYRPARSEHPSHHKTDISPSRGFSGMDAMLRESLVDRTTFQPKVLIWRCQNDNMMPAFGEGFSFSSVFSGPFFVVPRLDKKDPIEIDRDTEPKEVAKKMYQELQKTRLQQVKGNIRATAYLEFPGPHGLTISHIKDAYLINVQIKNPYRPASFNYTIGARGVTVIFALLHNDNVRLSGSIKDQLFDKGFILMGKKVAHAGDIPSQGLRPKYSKIRWKRVEHSNPEKERRLALLKLVFEIGISFIPYVGVLYDLGQVAYIYATGKDFFGDKVSPEGLAVYGLAVGIGVVARGSTALNRALKSGNYPVSQQVIDDVAEHINHSEDQFEKFAKLSAKKQAAGGTGADEFAQAARHSGELGGLETIALLPSGTHNQLITKLTKHGGVPTRGQAVQILKILGDNFDSVRAVPSNVNSKLITTILNREKVLRLIRANGSAFKNNFLNGHYSDYVKKAKGDPDSAIDWLTKSHRRKDVKAFLLKKFGPDYKKILEEAIYGRGIIVNPKALSPEVIKVYDNFFKKGKGVRTYQKINAERAKLPAELREIFSDMFEIDHLVERRFFEKWFGSDEFEFYQKLQSTLVPHRADVAEALINASTTGVTKIEYVHTAKTTLLGRLIKHGAENLYTMQEIVDAHLYVFKVLNAHFDPHLIKGDIEVLFRLRHGATPKAADPVMTALNKLDEARFLKENGWPDVKKVDGVWKKLN